MEVTYKKLYDDIGEITKQQALQLDWYHKVFKSNSIIKKMECYKDYKLWSIRYYLDSSENEQEVLQQLYQQVDYVSIIERKVPFSIYFLEREREYGINQVRPANFNRLYDAQNRLIFYEKYHDPNDIDYSDNKKYCYISKAVELGSNPKIVDYLLRFNYYKEENEDVEVSFIELFLGHDPNDILNTTLLEEFVSMEEVIDFLGNPVDYSYYLHPNLEP